MGSTIQTKRSFSLFMPSALGAVLYSFLSGLIILLHQFSAVKQYLQLPGDVDFIRMFTGWLDRTITGNVGESLTATLVVGLFWACVGMVVYAVLVGLARMLNELGEGFAQRGYLWPHGTTHNYRLKEAVERGVLRIAAFIGLVYILLGPLARLLQGSLLIGPSALSLFIWFVCLWLSLHACVVLLRLIALRRRLFE
ncbi:MAG: hypothetical protein JWP13_855 [Candidatus Saccharibacteria bacterium]|nr:hypothetical protein [Candidatus Saccharibacteria bacterium]